MYLSSQSFWLKHFIHEIYFKLNNARTVHVLHFPKQATVKPNKYTY